MPVNVLDRNRNHYNRGGVVSLVRAKQRAAKHNIPPTLNPVTVLTCSGGGDSWPFSISGSVSLGVVDCSWSLESFWVSVESFWATAAAVAAVSSA